MALHGRENKAQSVLEYAAVIACAVAALLAMQVYVKRAYQSRLKEVADQLGPHYAPRRTTGNFTTTYNSNSLSQSIIKSEIDLGYDLDGDGVLEDEVTATQSIYGLGTWSDSDSDEEIDETEISGGAVTRQVGNETVGPISYDEDLFDE